LKKALIIIFLILAKLSFATHIVGGAFDIQWTSGTNYVITLKVLRDCRSGQADFNRPNIRVGLYQKNNNSLIKYFTL
jgi:hypothetical protein